jgi:hypothetical protein
LGLFYGLKLVEGPCVVREFTSAATTTYDAGEIVTVTTGSVAIGEAGGLCGGVALKDAGGVTTMTPIIIITPEQIWSVCYNGTTALTQIGVDYLMTFTTGAQCLTSTTTTPTVTVVGLDPRDGAKLYGRLHVKFNQANCLFTGAQVAAS